MTIGTPPRGGYWIVNWTYGTIHFGEWVEVPRC